MHPTAGGRGGRVSPGNPAVPWRGARGHHPSSLRDQQRGRDKGRASQNPPGFQHQPFGILNH